MQRLTMTAPDDWHLHLRDGKALEVTVNDTAVAYERAIIMPNLNPPVATADDARQYRARILAALRPGLSFEPLMTLYLTPSTTAQTIEQAHQAGVSAVKWYPAGATTNSQFGVHDVFEHLETLSFMAELGMPLLIHGEVTTHEVDVFDRERVFIESTLAPLIERLPKLKVVFEHISTQEAVDFIEHAPNHVGATITAHHMLLNRNDMLVQGIKPHYYCLPILKDRGAQAALLKAATSGNPKFFLGTDSAPHAVGAKESSCGCAGIYSAPVSLPIYAQLFEQVDALDKLEGFASLHGPAFYGLQANKKQISLVKKPWQVPDTIEYDGQTLRPLMAGETLTWQIEH